VARCDGEKRPGSVLQEKEKRKEREKRKEGQERKERKEKEVANLQQYWFIFMVILLFFLFSFFFVCLFLSHFPNLALNFLTFCFVYLVWMQCYCVLLFFNI